MRLTQQEMHEAGEKGELIEALDDANRCRHTQTIRVNCGPVLDDIMCTQCNQSFTDVCQKSEYPSKIKVTNY